MASEYYFQINQRPKEVPGVYDSFTTKQGVQVGIIHSAHIKNKIWRQGVIGGTFRALLNLAKNIDGLNGREKLLHEQ